MTNRTRGWLMAIVAMATFAIVTELAFAPVRKSYSPPAPPTAVVVPVVPVPSAGNGALCDELVAKYTQLLAGAATCTADPECVVEDRAATWSGLDGCHRFRGRAAPTEADGIALRWRTIGCADQSPATPRDACPTTMPQAQCRNGSCVERPPSPLPSDWKRHTAHGVAHVFVPLDFEEVDTDATTHGTAVFYRELAGEGRTLTIVLTRQGLPLSADNAADAFSKVAARRPIAIGGYGSTLFTVVATTPLAATDAGVGPRRVRAMAELADVGSREDAGASTRLIFTMSCQTREQCDVLASIVENAQLLATVSGQQKDAGAPAKDAGVPRRSR